MNKEGNIPSEVYIFSGLVLLGALSLFGFSDVIRKKIRGRDKVDVLDGSIERLEVAHINHNKLDLRYDHESNGRLLTAPNHYMDHVNRRGRNGLTLDQNKWAMERIWRD